MAEETQMNGLDRAIRARLDELPDMAFGILAMRAALLAVLDLHKSGYNDHAGGSDRPICLGCSDPKWNVLTFAPCETVLAIAEKLGVSAELEASRWPPPGFIDLGHLQPGDVTELPPGVTGAVWTE